MKKMTRSFTLLIFIFCLIFTGCGPKDLLSLSITPTTEPAITLNPTSTLTPTPFATPTSTPEPIKIESAIRQGLLTEIDTIGKGYIRNSIISPDGSIFVIVVTRGLYIYNPDTWQEIKFIPLTPGTTVESVVFSNDGKIFAAGDSNSDVTFWDTQTWEIYQTFHLNNGPIMSIDISPDGLNMVTVGGNYDTKYKLSLWNLTDGSLINAYYRDEFAGRVDFSADGTRIFYSEWRDVTIWYVKDLQLYDRIQDLGSYTIMPNRDIIANNGYVYDFEKNERYSFDIPLSTFEGIEDKLFIDDSTLLIKREYSDLYYLFNLNTRKLSEVSLDSLSKLHAKYPEIGNIMNKDQLDALGFIDYPSIIDVSNNGKYLIMTEGILEIENRTMIDYTIHDTFYGSSYQKLENGNLAVVKISSMRAKEGSITITTFSQEDFSVITKKNIDYDLEDSIDIAKVSPDGKLLATGLGNGTLCLWNIETKEITATIKYSHSSGTEFGRNFSFSSINFNEDSSQLITVGALDKIKNTWSTVDLSKISSETKLGIISPDGSLFAYNYSDSVIIVEYKNEKKQPIILENNSKKIYTKKFTNDSKMLIITDQDGIKIWSLDEQELLMEIPQYGNVIFSTDDSFLYTQSSDGIIGIWSSNN